MCNLYSIKTRRAHLARKFGLSDNRMAAFEDLSAIFPGYAAPVIKQSEDGDRELVLRSWGFVLLRDGYAPKRVTNARDDKVRTKFWRESFEKRRCLVPATAFCEPDEGKPALALDRVEGRGCSVCLSRCLSVMEGSDQEERAQCGYRGLCVSDYPAEPADEHDQS